MQSFEEQLKDFILRGLEEDIQDGDHTSLACIPAEKKDKARLIVKDEGVLAGVMIAKEIFKHLDKNCIFTELIADGTAVKYGDIAFTVEAKSQALLMGERLALNSMQRLSGIATLSRKFASSVNDLPVTILDTRKTTPLLRFLEKWAVKIGGASNYRVGLYDRIMIKDNHIDACGSITNAIERVHLYLKDKNKQLEITVEVRNIEELEEVMNVGGIQRIMLDNFDTDTMRKAVKLVNGKFELEASGGINLDNLRDYALTGVNFISSGAITHSYQSLDMSLKIMK